MSNKANAFKDKIRKRTTVYDELFSANNTNENVNVNDNENNDVDGNVNRNVNVNIKRSKKKKFEEEHTRQTYYIRNDILETLHEVAGNEKGEKTRIINEALEMYLKQ